MVVYVLAVISAVIVMYTVGLFLKRPLNLRRALVFTAISLVMLWVTYGAVRLNVMTNFVQKL